MKFSSIVNFALGAALVSEIQAETISINEGQNIANKINKLREGQAGNTRIPVSINSRRVTYNHEVSNLLAEWAESPISWLPHINAKNIDFCWHSNPFGTAPLCQSVTDSIVFENTTDWEYLLHGEADNGAKAISQALKFTNRAFNYQLCSKTEESDNYESCKDTTLKPGVYADPLSFSPGLLRSDLTETACYLTGMEPPWREFGDGKKNSFFCVGKFANDADQPEGDQPYMAVSASQPVCSACPADAPHCVENLCSDVTPAPTRAPVKRRKRANRNG